MQNYHYIRVRIFVQYYTIVQAVEIACTLHTKMRSNSSFVIDFCSPKPLNRPNKLRYLAGGANAVAEEQGVSAHPNGILMLSPKQQRALRSSRVRLC